MFWHNLVNYIYISSLCKILNKDLTEIYISGDKFLSVAHFYCLAQLTHWLVTPASVVMKARSVFRRGELVWWELEKFITSALSFVSVAHNRFKLPGLPSIHISPTLSMCSTPYCSLYWNQSTAIRQCDCSLETSAVVPSLILSYYQFWWIISHDDIDLSLVSFCRTELGWAAKCIFILL